MSVTHIPVYTLAEQTSPTTSDYLVVQSSATNGDVGLLPISSFMTTFIQSYIDQVTVDASTITLYTSMGWTAPT